MFPLQALLWPRDWVDVYLYSSMTAALKGVYGQQHTPAILYLRERPGTHCTGGWVGLPGWSGRAENFAPP